MAAAPDSLHQLVAGHDLAGIHAERVEQLELSRREPDRDTVHIGLNVAGVDQQLLEVESIATCRRRPGDSAPGGNTDTCDELGHGERLDEIVVGAELERPDTILLSAARADDDDRRTDPLAPNRLDDLPAVDAGQHEIEHTDIRLTVPESRKAGLALVDDGRLEARKGQ